MSTVLNAIFGSFFFKPSYEIPYSHDVRSGGMEIELPRNLQKIEFPISDLKLGTKSSKLSLYEPSTLYHDIYQVLYFQYAHFIPAVIPIVGVGKRGAY